MVYVHEGCGRNNSCGSEIYNLNHLWCSLQNLLLFLAYIPKYSKTWVQIIHCILFSCMLSEERLETTLSFQKIFGVRKFWDFLKNPHTPWPHRMEDPLCSEFVTFGVYTGIYCNCNSSIDRIFLRQYNAKIHDRKGYIFPSLHQWCPGVPQGSLIGPVSNLHRKRRGRHCNKKYFVYSSANDTRHGLCRDTHGLTGHPW